ncbi:hypothetical protein BGZ95_002074 [Linnemannia exigua]|uniref:Calcineurin-like phosphoesterase domain-containing protein n=1 Tax=Linnemannia exigua TaxID=604196 RepID=A0AAD4D616_9FUNG|nr:hypothetical protein BGZ95_002074 [Linnemannia exigua]
MLTRILLGILYTATGIAILGTVVLHNHARITCHWNWESTDSFMRMVVFADPQMEGDAKIRRLGKRAHVDLAFNDAFMRHIYKKMMSPSWEPLTHLSSLLSRSTESHAPRSPTHVSILGDLFSSQWIDDTEFEVRVARYRSIFPEPTSSVTTGSGGVGAGKEEAGSMMPVVMINITGNHDIGYGYDISQYRVERWEQVFGKSNFISSMDIPAANVVVVGGSESSGNDTESRSSTQGHGTSNRKLHLVVLNTMLLDGPSSDENLRGQTWEFLQEASALKEANPLDRIVLLTHIPFHKEQGICVDPPDIREGQNVKTEEEEVSQQQQQPAQKVREVTQRSMMAEFGGYSGLFEIKTPTTTTTTTTSENNDDLEFHYTACGFFNDLQVWTVIITDIIVALLWCLLGLVYLISSTITFTTSSGQAARRKANTLSSEKQKIL